MEPSTDRIPDEPAPKPGLRVLDGCFDVYRLPVEARIPEHLLQAAPVWIARTHDELSIICAPDDGLAAALEVSPGWAAIQVIGPIEHTVIGLLADIARALAAARITIFAQSSYDTDYVLVAEGELARAQAALRGAGYPLEPRLPSRGSSDGSNRPACAP